MREYWAAPALAPQSLLEDFPSSWKPKKQIYSPLYFCHPASAVGQRGRWYDTGWGMGVVTGLSHNLEPRQTVPIVLPVATCLLGGGAVSL